MLQSWVDGDSVSLVYFKLPACQLHQPVARSDVVHPLQVCRSAQEGSQQFVLVIFNRYKCLYKLPYRGWAMAVTTNLALSYASYLCISEDFPTGMTVSDTFTSGWVRPLGCRSSGGVEPPPVTHELSTLCSAMLAFRARRSLAMRKIV